MTDTASSRYKARKQSLGSNTNTWGDTKLNDVIDTIDRGSKGYESTAITGDLTLSWSNYTVTNPGQVAVYNLTGSLSSSATITVPSVEWAWDSIRNATGQTITVKTSAGSGVTIPNGYRMAVYCDGTDCYSASPTRLIGDLYAGGQIKNLTAGTSGSTDAVNVTQMDAAIAAASITGTGNTLKVTSSDTTSKYLNTALATSKAISNAVTNPGANETITQTVQWGALQIGSRQTAGFSAASNTRYPVALSANGTITLPASPTDQDVIEFAFFLGTFTPTISANGKTINGLSSLVLPNIRETMRITYDATLGDWT